MDRLQSAQRPFCEPRRERRRRALLFDAMAMGPPRGTPADAANHNGLAAHGRDSSAQVELSPHQNGEEDHTALDLRRVACSRCSATQASRGGLHSRSGAMVRCRFWRPRRELVLEDRRGPPYRQRSMTTPLEGRHFKDSHALGQRQGERRSPVAAAPASASKPPPYPRNTRSQCHGR